MILVTGATGNVGSEVVRELRRRGAAVRAFVRDPARAAERLGDGVEIAAGDLADPASLRHALAGVDALFLACSNQPDQVELETGAIDAAAAAGVARIVKLSTLAARAGSPVAFFDWQGLIEEHLRRSGVPHVIVGASFFMTNLLAASETIRGEGRIYAPAGDARITVVDPRDVAAVAAAALTGGLDDGRTHVVTGPEAITYADIAGMVSEVAGRTVEFVDVLPEAARQAMVAGGMPGWLAANVVGVFGALRDGVAEEATATVRAVTGREPRSFPQFAAEHAAAFRLAGRPCEGR